MYNERKNVLTKMLNMYCLKFYKIYLFHTNTRYKINYSVSMERTWNKVTKHDSKIAYHHHELYRNEAIY